MRRRIVEIAARPELWLGLLLAWICLAALRSWHTPWARAAVTEALRWSVGIGLALSLGAGLKRTSRMAQALTVGLGLLVCAAISSGCSPAGMVVGPYGDHQLSASALLVLLPFAAALALAAPRPAWRWGGQIVALAAAVCLAFTQTRSAWAGTIVGVCLFARLWLGRRVPEETQGPRLPRLMMSGLLAAGVVLAFALIVRGTDLGDPLAARATTLSALGRDADWQWRLQTWVGDLRMIAVHPLDGWGPGHYPSAHWRFTLKAAPITPEERPTLSDQAHDLYLQTAADLGLFGLGLYLVALAAFARLALRTLATRASAGRREERHAMRDALLVASVSSLGAQGVDALASPSWQFTEVSLLFWLGLGLGLAATRRVTSSEDETPLSAPIRRALQCCAAGSAAVLLVAQVLPVGLLSPVEAYSQPINWTLASLTVNGSTNAITYQAGATVTYSMTAIYQYTDSGGQTHSSSPMTFTNSSDCKYVNQSGASLFVGNVLNVAKGDRGKTLVIKGTFMDNNGPHSATTTLTIS
jgi:hypothetical protein